MQGYAGEFLVPISIVGWLGVGVAGCLRSLAQLKLIGTDKVTAQAIADWHYWVAHENDF